MGFADEQANRTACLQNPFERGYKQAILSILILEADLLVCKPVQTCLQTRFPKVTYAIFTKSTSSTYSTIFSKFREQKFFTFLFKYASQ
jgi:hypothetical protein